MFEILFFQLLRTMQAAGQRTTAGLAKDRDGGFSDSRIGKGFEGDHLRTNCGREKDAKPVTVSAVFFRSSTLPLTPRRPCNPLRPNATPATYTTFQFRCILWEHLNSKWRSVLLNERGLGIA